jgi:hypothetical protein
LGKGVCLIVLREERQHKYYGGGVGRGSGSLAIKFTAITAEATAGYGAEAGIASIVTFVSSAAQYISMYSLAAKSMSNIQVTLK